MSFWDAAISIGMKVVGAALSGGGSSSSVAAPTASKKIFDTSKYKNTQDFSKLTASERRGLDPTARAKTVREKGEEPVSEEDEGADSVALARMWNEVFGDGTE